MHGKDDVTAGGDDKFAFMFLCYISAIANLILSWQNTLSEDKCAVHPIVWAGSIYFQG